jgi:hypothetical protein
LHVNKSRELDRLVGKVEEVLARLPADSSPETNALRENVDRTILATWLALGSEPARRKPPWRHQRGVVTIAVTMLVGIVAGSVLRRML